MHKLTDLIGPGISILYTLVSLGENYFDDAVSAARLTSSPAGGNMKRGQGRKLVNKIDENSSSDLPPPRPGSEGKALTEVANPINSIDLSTFLYLLGGGVFVYFIYQMLGTSI